ncbi:MULTISPECIES: TldD/PmbA family protein [unclassified Leptolyngbya]|uniref:TldD/PmbA family protein n=1 Tax=unclassified Leptolyngbya TaxID=2650499 RepID=UPI001685492C|nr:MULTISPECIES: TldD/PmbA family protein [unclassified Leptolyngbya]MBD1910914.1 TldD/PmbA family protein [Leptolyngbya sp. FACHB-8]MBD2154959.1 TldD/PmbA family protein [Leptolyngbya sp. FACHB-16]
MPTNIDNLATQVQEAAHRLGIQKYDIYGASVDETSVQVDHGEPKQVKASNRSSVTVRVWNGDGTVGVTSTSEIDPTGLELALKTAYEASEFGIKENSPDFSPEATAPINVTGEDTAPQSAVAELIEKLIVAEKDLMATHPAITSVPYNGLSQRDVDRFYLNSDGARRHDIRSAASIYLYSKTEQDGKKPRSAGAFRVARNVEGLDIPSCVEEAAEKTISHLTYEKIKTGKYPVVFSPDAILSLMGAFSNLFNAQNILDKQSLSTSESLGTAIASPLISLYDDSLHPENIGGETFDGEGTPTRRLALIEKGVLANFMHSAGTAKRMNAQPTGHANMGSKVTVGRHFYHIFQGEPASKEYKLEDADGVIYIDDLQALHAGVQSLQGSFSLPFDGWLIENGKRTSIESATVAGDFRQVLNSILYVEKDLELVGGGIAPRVWVEELSITGE